MRKVQELTPADFPSIDAAKFEEWKQALKDAERNTIILLVALVVINIVLYIATGSIVLGGLLLLIIFIFIWRRSNRLFKELGLTRATLKAARSKPAA